MRKISIRFPHIVAEIARINAERATLVLSALETLEQRHPALAQVLLESVGSRQLAAYWMCARRRSLDGRNACELLADGDEDGVWDLLSRAGRVDAEGNPCEVHTA
jgi:hypothetical protein